MSSLDKLYKNISAGERKTIVADYCKDPAATLQSIVEAMANIKATGGWYPYGKAEFASDAAKILISEILQNAIDAESQPVVDDSAGAHAIQPPLGGATQTPKADEDFFCEWEEDTDANWSTGCGKFFYFDNGGPGEDGFSYCPYCQSEIAVNKYDDPAPLDDSDEDEAWREKQNQIGAEER